MNEPAIQLEDLEVVYRVRGVDRNVLRGVSLTIGEGESYGLVGESGCGKTTAAFAIMRALPRNGRVISGSIRVNGEDLLGMGQAGVRKLRATTLSMVYQNPAAALNPTIRVGAQVGEVFELMGFEKKDALERARLILAKVQISDPQRVMRRYPHQLSGGMQQRVVIAMALAKDPTLLILDEPTTGLDATVEAEVLDLIAALRQEFGTSVLFISHNLAVIAKMCEQVGVLYAGRVVEEGPADQVFRDPRHPYTVGLLRCIPRGGVRKDETPLDTIPGFLPRMGAEIEGCVLRPGAAWSRRSAARKSLVSIRSGMGGRAVVTSTSRRTSFPGRRRPSSSRPGTGTARRSSPWSTPARPTGRRARTSTPSRISRSQSAQGRSSGSWASPAAARRRSPASSWG